MNFENLSNEDIQAIKQLMDNINRHRLSMKPHIKKYYKYRKLHGDVLDSMESYFEKGHYKLEDYFKAPLEKGKKYPIMVSLCSDNPDDVSIIMELLIYKNQEDIKSITEVYLEKNKFKNKDKIKMLNAMNNSFASLFKVVDVDFNEGRVTYLDVFSGKKYKVIDVSLSSSLRIDKKNYLYLYNRLITIDGVTFGTGIHCMFTGENKELLNYIKEYKSNDISGSGCLLKIYEIYRKYGNTNINFKHNYI